MRPRCFAFAAAVCLLATACADRDRSSAATYPAAATLEPPSPTTEFAPPEAQPVGGIDDHQFVAQAASSGKFEVESSRHVLAHDTDPAAIAFAEMMVRDHTRANEELKALAADKGFSLSERMLPKHQDLLLKIDGTPSEQVGEIYLRIQQTAHQEAIALFERCAEECRDSDLRAFANRTLPILRAHLDHAVQRVPGVSP